ncbi:MAG: hypothetical protein IT443_09110, partial [Phycisphaeraceae bacterium]|nr:hypothetical protein [Phycisphaeraceae bacterium]
MAISPGGGLEPPMNFLPHFPENNVTQGSVEFRESFPGGRGIVECRLPIADCRLPIADCRLPIADCRLPIADCRLPIADCRLPI